MLKKILILAAVAVTGILGVGITHALHESSRTADAVTSSYRHSGTELNQAKVSGIIQQINDQVTETGSTIVAGGDGGEDTVEAPVENIEQFPETEGWIDATPIDGDVLTFPRVGEVFSGRIINTQQAYNLPRGSVDTCTWEFAYGYISTTTRSEFQRMRRRALAISNYVVNPDDSGPLKVKLNSGEELYVGVTPIAGFGELGDIIEFTYTDGSSMKVLVMDAKARNDRQGTGFANQANTEYCHAVMRGDVWSLSAVELWCGGPRTSLGHSLPNTDKNIESAKIVGHTNILTGL